LLRQGQEIRLLQAMRLVRAEQLDEAKANLEAAMKGRELARLKRTFYATREFMNLGEALAMALSVDAAVMSTAIQLAHALASTTRIAVPQVTWGAAGF